MRFIPTRIHGALDYALGIVLAALPYVAGFADRGIAEWASVILGCGLIIPLVPALGGPGAVLVAGAAAAVGGVLLALSAEKLTRVHHAVGIGGAIAALAVFGLAIGPAREGKAFRIQQGSKYIETPWRKTPEYQGGFLLDGGVHFIAGLRCLLGSEAKAASLSAFTAQHQSYLPPVDSADAVLKLKNGGQGTFSLSFGTTATGNEWAVACEGGEVIVEPFEGKVTVKAKGETEGKTEEAKDEFGGVKQEVFAWAKSIKECKPDPKQSPEEALGDLEMLEAILKSGQRDGIPVNLYHQT